MSLKSILDTFKSKIESLPTTSSHSPEPDDNFTLRDTSDWGSGQTSPKPHDEPFPSITQMMGSPSED